MAILACNSIPLLFNLMFSLTFGPLSPVYLIELHWLPYPQGVKYKVCMVMFKWLKGLAPAYFVAFCTKGAAVCGRLALRSAVCRDLVVPSHRTDWGLRTFAFAGSSYWNGLPVELRVLTVGLRLLQNTWRTYRFRVGFFWWSTHFWVYLAFFALSSAIIIIINYNNYNN